MLLRMTFVTETSPGGGRVGPKRTFESRARRGSASAGLAFLGVEGWELVAGALVSGCDCPV